MVYLDMIDLYVIINEDIFLGGILIWLQKKDILTVI